MKPQTQSQENPLLNLVINIFLPVVILNKGNKFLDPKWTLLIALLLPLGYGLHDYIRRGHKNYVSLLGLVNILLTGGLALMSLKGIWFAFKEASLPLLLGILVLGSRWTKNPAARMMFCNPQVLNMDLVNERLSAFGRERDFRSLLERTTVWLSLSFFVSSALNFFLAYDIFRDIDPALEAAAREQILNEQIARMTWMGFAVIALPLMVFSAILVYFFLSKMSKMTQVPINSLLKS
jgi:hypothetical protein